MASDLSIVVLESCSWNCKLRPGPREVEGLRRAENNASSAGVLLATSTTRTEDEEHPSHFQMLLSSAAKPKPNNLLARQAPSIVPE